MVKGHRIGELNRLIRRDADLGGKAAVAGQCQHPVADLIVTHPLTEGYHNT